MHYLWNYIKDTYSTKKTKDLVGSQTQKYKTMLNEYIENNHNARGSKQSDFIPPEELASMNDDLTQFLQQIEYTGEHLNPGT
jgi:hypothetical protein